MDKNQDFISSGIYRMASSGSELTFLRCSSCRSLIPSSSTRCRMCGYKLEEAGDEASDASPESKKSQRVRLRTMALTASEVGDVTSPPGTTNGRTGGSNHQESADLADVDEAVSTSPLGGQEVQGNYSVADQGGKPAGLQKVQHIVTAGEAMNILEPAPELTGDENPLHQYLVSDEEEYVEIEPEGSAEVIEKRADTGEYVEEEDASHGLELQGEMLREEHLDVAPSLAEAQSAGGIQEADSMNDKEDEKRPGTSGVLARQGGRFTTQKSGGASRLRFGRAGPRPSAPEDVEQGSGGEEVDVAEQGRPAARGAFRLGGFGRGSGTRGGTPSRSFRFERTAGGKTGEHQQQPEDIEPSSEDHLEDVEQVREPEESTPLMETPIQATRVPEAFAEIGEEVDSEELGEEDTIEDSGLDESEAEGYSPEFDSGEESDEDGEEMEPHHLGAADSIDEGESGYEEIPSESEQPVDVAPDVGGEDDVVAQAGAEEDVELEAQDVEDEAVPVIASQVKEPKVDRRSEPRQLQPQSSPATEPGRSLRHEGSTKSDAGIAATAVAREIKTDGKLGGRLFGWLVSYLDPDGAAVELREGKFFVSSEKIRPGDLVIDDASVSSPHAMISVFIKNGLVVQDLMSERGVFVRRRGKAAYRREEEATRLEHGDWVRLGDVEFLVVLIAHVGAVAPS